jgi:fatty-acid desaturase
MAGPAQFLRGVWGGHARLWQAFWLVGVIGFILWTLLLYVLLRALTGDPPNRWVALVFFVVPYVAAIIYVSVGVWRCAPNTAYAPMTALARVWAVVFAGGWLYKAALLVNMLVV